MKPVCFASVAFVDPGAPICTACPHRQACVDGAIAEAQTMPDTPAVRAALVTLRSIGNPIGQGRVGVTVSRRGIARRDLTAGEQARLQSLSSRAQGAAKRLAQTGWFELVKSRLPGVPDGPNQRITQALQAIVDGVRTRRELAMFFMTAGLSESSAQVEASTAIAVLEFGRIVRQDAHALTLSQD